MSGKGTALQQFLHVYERSSMDLGRANVELGPDATAWVLANPMTAQCCQAIPRYSPCPPATAMVWPVTQEASGEARNSATLAISSAWPMRPNGIEASVLL